MNSSGGVLRRNVALVVFVKTMMDVGRAFMFRDKGFAADIISYIDEETSMENRLPRAGEEGNAEQRGVADQAKARPNE